MARKTIAQKMEEQRLLIFNSRKPEILPFLEPMGIDIAHLDTGKNLYEKVVELDNIKKKEYQEQNLAYDIYQDAKNRCEPIYKRTRKLVKMASRSDKNLQDRLKLKLTRSRVIEEWILQQIEFYNLLANETVFLGKISKYGLTIEQLNTEKEEIASLQLLRNEAMSEKGQAQEATSMRDKKKEELEDYCYELKTVATIALEEHPQLLEKLGMIIRS